tara:strand:- start:4 stop:258 length:255 start_codon:yes stop_codon:yes gene_type:complete
MFLEEISTHTMSWHSADKLLVAEASDLRWPGNFYSWTNEPIVVSHHTGEKKMFRFTGYVEYMNEIRGTKYKNEETGICLHVLND